MEAQALSFQSVPSLDLIFAILILGPFLAFLMITRLVQSFSLIGHSFLLKFFTNFQSPYPSIIPWIMNLDRFTSVHISESDLQEVRPEL